MLSIKLSLSVSCSIILISFPVFFESISFNLALDFKILSAAILISVAWPWTPPSGWWIITSALLRQYLFPICPLDNRKAAIDAAIPTHIVDTSLEIKFIVSYIAIPAVMLPPGEFMYIEMSSWFSPSRYNSCATILLETSSFISPLRIIILSLRSLE